ncbi:10488_t:CDS:2 [Dentiscutata heterogama]|uniref:10488_t:CDS:1 n=1 Tax=Dentiscutata heterogama TaxID=1316150 RepID=A0ACA9PL07_9GLOM|nr:10488_t:CDS:2 [Dentiscutata heterogama]
MVTNHGKIDKKHGGDSPEETSIFLSIFGPALGEKLPKYFDAKLPNISSL